MYSAMLALHIGVCFIIIIVVLLQAGKGSDIGAAFGGGSSQTLFGSRGPQSFLGKMTTATAILFMLTSLFLATLSSRKKSNSVVLNQPVAQDTAPRQAPAATPETK